VRAVVGGWLQGCWEEDDLQHLLCTCMTSPNVSFPVQDGNTLTRPHLPGEETQAYPGLGLPGKETRAVVVPVQLRALPTNRPRK
jgi:hypothetical protein